MSAPRHRGPATAALHQLLAKEGLTTKEADALISRLSSERGPPDNERLQTLIQEIASQRTDGLSTLIPTLADMKTIVYGVAGSAMWDLIKAELAADPPAKPQPVSPIEEVSRRMPIFWIGDGGGSKDTQSFENAVQLLTTAITAGEQLYGQDDPRVAVLRAGLATRLVAEGKLGEAEMQLLHALRIIDRAYGKGHPDYGVLLVDLGVLDHARGKYDEAIRLIRTGLPLIEAGNPPSALNIAAALFDLAVNLNERDEGGEATPLLERSLELTEKLPLSGWHYPEMIRSALNESQRFMRPGHSHHKTR
jgi:tetratricopeptide (TPR) repeat protein